MSIDANAGERQERVRRPKEKPRRQDIEIDSTLPRTPSKFPLVPALIALFVVAIGGGVFAYRMTVKSDEITPQQRANLDAVRRMQDAFNTLWDSTPTARDTPSCRVLIELIRRPCRKTVDVTKLAVDEAVIAIGGASCVSAVEAYSRSRIDAKCD